MSPDAVAAMVAIKTSLYRWRREISAVLSKPRVLISVIVIGFFMLWLAGEQVRATFKFLVHYNLAESGKARRLADKYRYLLFGVLILAFVWLDLMLLHSALTCVRAAVKWYQERVTWSRKAVKHRNVSGTPLRKNPMRACRKSSSL